MNRFKNTIKEIKLSKSEKKEMLGSIVGYPSPFVSFNFFFEHSFVRVVAAALVAFFAVGGSVSAFAEKSIPGDVLYPVKVGVNEKISGAVAITPEKKVKHETTLVSRRLEEVEKVLTKEEITTEEKKEIISCLSEDISTHRENASSQIDEIYNSGDVATAISASTELGTTMDTHIEVISQVESKDPAVSQITEDVVDHVALEVESSEKQTQDIVENPLPENSENSQESFSEDIVPQLKEVLGKEKDSFTAVFYAEGFSSKISPELFEKVSAQEILAKDFEQKVIDQELLSSDQKEIIKLLTEAISSYKKANSLISLSDSLSVIKEVSVGVPVVETTPSETSTDPLYVSGDKENPISVNTTTSTVSIDQNATVDISSSSVPTSSVTTNVDEEETKDSKNFFQIKLGF